MKGKIFLKFRKEIILFPCFNNVKFFWHFNWNVAIITIKNMKMTLFKNIEKIALLAVMFFSSIVALAQNSTPSVDVTTNTTSTTTTEEWFTNPLYWVVGALLLIILIAVVARGGKKE